jgi:heme-degrading monooxygenase HmoA
MDETNQRFTTGVWLVKSGKEKDFIAAWGDTPTWILNHNLGAIEFYLLQDIQEPRRFISTGSWESIQKIAAWKQLPESAEFIAKMKELCDELTIPVPTMKPVIHLKR